MDYNYRIINRRDTAANWVSVNPVLASGEIGYDETNRKIKIGDGATAWNDLAFYGGGGSGSDVYWQDIINKPNFATVATSGSYNDLSNKPVIPEVHNGKLTINVNGVPTEFTANQKEDTVVDIDTGGGGSGWVVGNGLVLHGGVIGVHPTPKFKFVDDGEGGKNLDVDTNVIATTEYVNEKIGEINTVLSSI